MLRVGLTGSIAVGKTYVCGILAELGCHVLDADETSREVVRRGSVGLGRVVEAFGESVRAEDGTLDRKALGSLIFADEAKRQLLNSILHPLIKEAQNEWLAERQKADPEGIAVIEAALMIESGSYKRFDELIVVWCEPEIQLRRLVAREKISPEEARERIAAQMDQEEKKRFATFLIDTSKGFDQTRAETVTVFAKIEEKRKS